MFTMGILLGSEDIAGTEKAKVPGGRICEGMYLLVSVTLTLARSTEEEEEGASLEELQHFFFIHG